MGQTQAVLCNWERCNTIRRTQIKLHRLIEPVNQEKWNCFPSLGIIIFREINRFTVWLKQPWFHASSTVNEHMSVLKHPRFTTLNIQRGETHWFYSSSLSQERCSIYSPVRFNLFRKNECHNLFYYNFCQHWFQWRYKILF